MKSTRYILIFILTTLSTAISLAQNMKIGDPSKNDGKVEWKPMQIVAGEVPFGIPVEKAFEVKNVSTEDLLILNVKSGCHCTVVDWPKEPILPGQTGHIKITFDALKEGEFYKIIAVTTNFDPEVSLALSMIGKVLPKPVDGH